MKTEEFYLIKVMRCDDDGHSKYVVAARFGDVTYLSVKRYRFNDAMVVKGDLSHGGEFDESEFTKLSDKYSV